MSRPTYIFKLAVALLLAVFATQAAAYYTTNLPIQVRQPDGKTLDLLASGDEYHNWLHDKDNFTIIQNPQTGWYCYAQRAGEGVEASPLVVGEGDPRSLGLEPGINISEGLYKQQRRERFYRPVERDAPTTGTINNLVIYIRFSDETEFGQQNSIYDGWFNTSANSQKNYFLEASYNQLTVNTHFYPVPSGGYVVSWQDSQPRAYYQPYNASTNPSGYSNYDQRCSREFTLLQNAVNGVRSQIPSSLNIDSDGDGQVDNVVFIVRGAADGWNSLLWPHRWAIFDRNVYINNKRVYDFNFQLQDFLANRGVGVICHEFFHTLGAPDLYHYSGDGMSPAGPWDLMNSDQNPPQHMTAFMKWKYGDWIPSIPTLSEDGVYTLNPLTSSTGQCFRINSNNPDQYYVVEFRKKTGTYENSVPGSGLLVYRIDTSCGDGNSYGPPDELYIYRPGGTTTANGNINSAHFSQETGRTKIYTGTNPSPFLQDGSDGNLYLCEIGSSAGNTMSFRLGPPFINFVPNPYIQGFDATEYPPGGWTSQAQSGSYTFTRVTSGSYPSCSPQSGAGMLRYESYAAPSGNSALLVSPRIEVSNHSGFDYGLSFWMYRDGNLSTAADKIEVYLNGSAGLSGSPILLGTIHRARQLDPVESSPGWKNYSFDLPFSAAGNYYVVFRAVSAYGYNMFLDNIRIAQLPFAAHTPSPAHLSTRVMTNTQLTWQSGGGSPTGYKLYLGTSNPPAYLADVGNNLSYSPSLASNTTYYWSVVPYGPGGDAVNCPVWSFSTIAANDLQATQLWGTGCGRMGEALHFDLDVKNNGSQTQNSYLVRLMSTGQGVLASQQVNEPLAMDASATHTLTWTPSASGHYTVYGEVLLNGDEVSGNNCSPQEAVHVLSPQDHIANVGNLATASTTNILPLNFYWKNSLSETVYLAEELQMQSGTLQGMVYVNNFTQDLANKPVKIWLKNTDAANVSTGWLPFNGYQLVFDGVVDFPSGSNLVFIPFSAPFAYNGQNLALRCNRPMDTAYFSSDNKFYYNTSTAQPSRSRYIQSDNTAYDPTAPTAPGTLSNNIPVTSFIAENAALPPLPAPQVSISQLGTDVSLTWDVQPGYHGYKVFASDDPYVWPEQPAATVYEPQFSTGSEARMFFKVLAFSQPSSLPQLPGSSRLRQGVNLPVTHPGTMPDKD